MTENQNKLLILCDSEQDYVHALGEYMQTKKDFPWLVSEYTELKKINFERLNGQIGLLLISEALFEEDIDLEREKIVVLNESGLINWKDVKNIDKYRCADDIYRDVLEYYVDNGYKGLPRLVKEANTKFIGIYSPIRRCLQTSFAISMSQLLSKDYKVLYLNFEHYPGILEMIPDIQTRDLADLMFFLNTESEKFGMRMKTMIHKLGSLDYIPPMKVGQNLIEISKGEWLLLMERIAKEGDYDYVIMDLSENMQGLFDVLRSCFRVYTIVCGDRIAELKQNQYEQLLLLYKYDDVISKTKKCAIPKMKRLPLEIEQYSKGDLVEYVKSQIEDIIKN